MIPSLRHAAAVLALAAITTTGCSSDNGPTDPGALAPTAVNAAAAGATSVRITFTGLVGDQGYTVQRATGATG
jgi:hypothetical protein